MKTGSRILPMSGILLLSSPLGLPRAPGQEPHRESALPLADPAGAFGERNSPSGAPARAEERGVPALFSWGDFDGDVRLDLAAVGGDGTLRLLASAGEGRFEDVTERVGLGEVGATALALWADYDGDGRLDLFVGARAGTSRLFHNEGGLFVDMSTASGLASEGAVQSAQWLDHDDDGRLDLFVVTAAENGLQTRLFRGLEGGFFEQAELPLAGTMLVPAGVPFSGVDTDVESPGGPVAVPRSSSAPGTDRSSRSVGGLALATSSGGRTAPATGASGGSSSALLASCLPAIRDQANPNMCLQASTTPALGKLYPISANLFVAVGGDVGIGTTSPSARLHVAGTARMTDTLTLAPSGDQALDVSTGSIYKGGFLFIHTKGGAANTAIGYAALTSATSGYNNTASGASALRYNDTGSNNTANGSSALYSNTSGILNTASGALALRYNTVGTLNTACGALALRDNLGDSNTASGGAALHHNTVGNENTASGTFALLSNLSGSGNMASGARALSSNTTGSFNTASGYRALNNNSTGDSNIALGDRAGLALTTGSRNIAIGNYGVAAESATIRIGTPGTQTRAFLAGIHGVTTGVADAIPVLVDSAGQLGTISSSRRFKEEIRDMGDTTERLLELRPVVFRYKPEVQSGERPLEYGLIAEEVAEVFPELVVYDEEGLPFTVKYHLLSSMLLNELKKQARAVEELEAVHARRLEEQSGELEELRARSEAQTREVEEVRSELSRLREVVTRMAASGSRAHEMTTPAAAEQAN